MKTNRKTLLIIGIVAALFLLIAGSAFASQREWLWDYEGVEPTPVSDPLYVVLATEELSVFVKSNDKDCDDLECDPGYVTTDPLGNPYPVFLVTLEPTPVNLVYPAPPPVRNP